MFLLLKIYCKHYVDITAEVKNLFCVEYCLIPFNQAMVASNQPMMLHQKQQFRDIDYLKTLLNNNLVISWPHRAY